MGDTAICFQLYFICIGTFCSGDMEWMNEWERIRMIHNVWKKLIWYSSTCSGVLNQGAGHNRSITFVFYKETQRSWQQLMCNTKLASTALGPRLLSKPLRSAKPQEKGNNNLPERSARRRGKNRLPWKLTWTYLWWVDFHCIRCPVETVYNTLPIPGKPSQMFCWGE